MIAESPNTELALQRLRETTLALDGLDERWRYERELFRQIVENIPSGAVLIVGRDEDGFLYYERAMGNGFAKAGYPKNELVGRRLKDVLNGDDIAMYTEWYSEALGGSTITQHEYQKGGVWAIRLFPIENLDGEITRAGCVAQWYPLPPTDVKERDGGE